MVSSVEWDGDVEALGFAVADGAFDEEDNGVVVGVLEGLLDVADGVDLVSVDLDDGVARLESVAGSGVGVGDGAVLVDGLDVDGVVFGLEEESEFAELLFGLVGGFAG